MTTLTRTAALSLCLAAALAAFSIPSARAAEPKPFEPIDRLVGQCFQGEFAPGVKDVQCYEWAVQEKFVRNTHEVTGPNGVYSGETFYGWSEEEGLRFWYFNSLGGVSTGSVEPAQGGGWQALESYERGDSRIELRTRFVFGGTGGYTVVTEQRPAGEGEWKTAREVVYTAVP